MIMGYTHYFKGNKSTDAKFKEFSNVCKKLHDNLPETTNIAGGDGTGKPIFDNEIICFNGHNELAHETFLIEKTGTDDFCKTARKPYDLLVVSSLIAAWQILGYNFSSDGIIKKDNTCDDLQPAIDFYNQIIKPEIPINQDLVVKQSMV